MAQPPGRAGRGASRGSKGVLPGLYQHNYIPSGARAISLVKLRRRPNRVTCGALRYDPVKNGALRYDPVKKEGEVR